MSEHPVPRPPARPTPAQREANRAAASRASYERGLAKWEAARRRRGQSVPARAVEPPAPPSVRTVPVYRIDSSGNPVLVRRALAAPPRHHPERRNNDRQA